jgi:phosphate/sulfate permease
MFGCRRKRRAKNSRNHSHSACGVRPTFGEPVTARPVRPLHCHVTRHPPCNRYDVPLWVILCSNVIIAAGTVYGGWGIIETMGVGITNLTCSSGFASNVGAVTAIFGATQLGIPISTTHAAAASIAGAGYADKSPVRLQVTVLTRMHRCCS